MKAAVIFRNLFCGWVSGAGALYLIAIASCCPLRIGGWSGAMGLSSRFACRPTQDVGSFFLDDLIRMPFGPMWTLLAFLAVAAILFLTIKWLVNWLLF